MRITVSIFMIVMLFANAYALDNKDDEFQTIPISSPVHYEPQAFDVIHYSATLDFHKAPAKDMQGVNKIKIYWLENPQGNLFYFHLRGLNVDSVKYNGSTAQYNEVETSASPVYHYEVTPPAEAERDTAIITVYYHGKMTNADNFGGVFSQKGYLYSVGVGFRNNYISSTQHWLACYDLPSDKATFDFTFITPKYLSVASNGLLQSESDYVDGDSTYKMTKWASVHPIATNLMTFAVAGYVKLERDNYEYPVVIYSLPKDTLKCELVFTKVPEMVRTYESVYGKYAFDKVGYVITSLWGGAMEHQTMITMNESSINSMYAARDSVNMTAAHELSHHWFGNSVTPYDYRDAWFNEGFATFSEAVWTEHLFGFKRYLSYLAGKISYYVNNIPKGEGVFPLYDFPRTSPSSNYPHTIYLKGAAVAAMLRYELGDSLFFNALKAYLHEKAYGNMTTAGFEKYLSNYTGRNLDWFFNQWVYGKGFPILEIHTLKSNSEADGYYKAEIHISQVQQKEWGIYKNLPVELVFAGLDGQRVDRVLRMNGKDTVYYLDSLPDFYAPLVNAGDSLRALLKVGSSVTSVDDNEKDIQIELYPNPASDFIFVSLNETKNISDLKLIDVTGKVLKRFKINKQINRNLIKLNLRDLQAGVYFLSVGNRDFMKTIKFIKN